MIHDQAPPNCGRGTKSRKMTSTEFQNIGIDTNFEHNELVAFTTEYSPEPRIGRYCSTFSEFQFWHKGKKFCIHVATVKQFFRLPNPKK